MFDLLKGLAIGAGVAATIVVVALVVMAIVWRMRLKAPPPPTGAVPAGPQPTVVPMKHRNSQWLNVLCQCLLLALIFGVPAALILPLDGMSRISPLLRWVLAAGWFCPCWAKISSFKGGVIAFLGRTWRDRGEGPIWIFRPFFIPFEAVVRDGLLDRGSWSFEIDAETSGEDSVPYAGRLNYSKRAGSQRNFHKMTEKERESSLKDWIKHFMSIEVRRFKNRKEATSAAALQKIGSAVRDGLRGAWIGGMKLEDYFGITIDEVIIADPGQPQALKDAETRREAAEQDAKAKDVIHKNFMKRVRAIQKNAVDNGEPSVPFEKAAETIQLNDGIIQKTVKHIDFGKNISGMVNGVGQGVADAGGRIATALEKILS